MLYTKKNLLALLINLDLDLNSDSVIIFPTVDPDGQIPVN